MSGLFSSPAIKPSANITGVYASTATLPVPVGHTEERLDLNGTKSPIIVQLVKNGSGSAIPASTLVTMNGASWYSGFEVKEASAFGEPLVGVTPKGATDMPASGWGWIIRYGIAHVTYGNEGGPLNGAVIEGALKLSNDTDGGKVVENYKEVFYDASRFREGATGTPLESAGTTPLMVDDGNGISVVSWATTDHAAAEVNIDIPDDYDEQQDDAALVFLYNQTGTTDTIQVATVIKQIGAGAVASADFNPTDPTVTQGSTAEVPVAEVVDISGNSIARGKQLQVTVDPPAHTTDALELYGVIFRYLSTSKTGMISLEATTTDDTELNVFVDFLGCPQA